MVPFRSLLVVAALSGLSLQKAFLPHDAKRNKAGTSIQLVRHNDRLMNALSRRALPYAAFSKPKRQNIPQSILANLEQDGAYSAVVFIGTPPQPLELILTTGTADLWTVTNQCDIAACDVTAGTVTFVPQNSSTFTSVPQPFVITLESGTLNGTISTDNVDFAGLAASNQRFLAVNSVSGATGLAGLNVSGFLGFGFDGVSQTGTTPLWRTLNETGQLGEPLMGLYLTRFSNITDALPTEPGGQLSLGYLNQTLFTGDLEYHDVVQHGPELTLFDIPITNFIVNGTSVELNTSSGPNPPLATINLGNSFIQGPSDNVNQIYSLLGGRNATGANAGFFELPCNATFECAMSFGGGIWNITSADTVSTIPSSPGFCIGLIAPTTADLETNTTWIIGYPFLKNVYTSFRWTPPSVGFAQLASPVLDGDVSFGLPETTSAALVSSTSGTSSSLSTPAAPSQTQSSNAVTRYASLLHLTTISVYGFCIIFVNFFEHLM